MAVGDVHQPENGASYVETEHGPNVWWVCQDCGERAAVNLESTVCRCQTCWARLAGVDLGQPMQVLQDQYRKSEPSPKVSRHLFWHGRK